MKNENKKNQKKNSENDFCSKAKNFRKKIFLQKSRNDSVAAGRINRGTPIATIMHLQYKHKTDVSHLYWDAYFL